MSFDTLNIWSGWSVAKNEETLKVPDEILLVLFHYCLTKWVAFKTNTATAQKKNTSQIQLLGKEGVELS